MNNYRRFTVAFILIELVLIIICNVFLIGTNRENNREYLVDIKRATDEIRAGADITEIDMREYPAIINISQYVPDEICNNEYRVEEINDVLYRFEYTGGKIKNDILLVNCVMAVCLVITIIMLCFVGKKVIRPFSSMNHLVDELSKGNLSVPVKAEKSKFFGKFLWGIDMLREKLEDDKTREMELVKEKKTLIMSLSHDIKTPLAAIDLYTKALSQNLYDSEEKREEAVKGIEKNVAEIKKYVSEIANASREDFLAIEVNNIEFYLHEVIDSIAVYYKEKMQYNRTEFIIDDVMDCLIYGDADRTVEVFQNVLENAIKYGDGKAVRITFDDEEDCKLITVSNTGCTLPGEECTYIFDSFYRGSNSDNINGSGLGLYICKKILQKMDGDIFAKIIKDEFCVTVVLRKM